MEEMMNHVTAVAVCADVWLHSLLLTLAQQRTSVFRDPITRHVAIGTNASSISGIPSLYGKVVADKKKQSGNWVLQQKKKMEKV